jgi:integrase
VRAVVAWLEAAGLDRRPDESAPATGPLFRRVDKAGKVGGRLSGKAVALIVKRAARRAGMDAVRFAGHSLRSGFATTAAANGADLLPIMAQTRHRSERVARGYVQRGSIFRNRAVAALGL